MKKDSRGYPLRRTKRFNRSAVFIAVKPIRLSSKDTLEVGTEIPNTFRRYHINNLYRRFRIGEKGDPWTDGQIAAWREQGGITVSSKPEEPPQPSGGEPAYQVGEYKIYAVGSGWHSVRNLLGEEVEKIRGQEAVEEWIEERFG